MDGPRTSPKYHAVHNETDLGDYRYAPEWQWQGSDIELVPQRGPSHSYYGPEYTNSPILYSTETLKPQISTTRTTSVSRDDEYLLAGKSGKDHIERPSNTRFLSGWRIGALLSLVGAILVFVLNLVMTIWVLKKKSEVVQGGIGTLLQGSCFRVRRLNVWAHLIVNAISTLLLCASNYCMQVLSAPSRAEVDHAHSNRHWLHIGVPSLHNLVRIAKARSLLWTLLMLSSLPLHLLFNSVIFTNLQANDYVVVPTMEDWLSGAKYNTSSFVGFSSGKADAVGALFDPYRPNLTDTSGDLPRYKNVSTELCLSQYNVQYTTLVGNVYIVQSQPTVWRNQTLWKLAVHNITGDFVWYTGSPPNPENYKWQNANTTFPYRSRPETVPSNGWRCPSRRNSTCNVEDEREVPSDKSKWAPYESPVRYCLVEQVPEICKLQFSFIIASVVIVSNLIKAGCIAWLLLRYKKHEALVTLGDAVASFLECVDLTTRGRCLQSKAEVERHFNGNTLARIDHMPDRVLKPQRFEPIRQKWSMAPSYGTWFAAYMFYFGAVLFGILAIIWSLDGMPSGLAKLWKVGFGSVNGKNLLSIGTSLMGSVLLANTPQVILSYLYITFNTLYTNMFIAREWATYLNQRKTLRVTAPIGQQRETYWLSVPFRFAIPMTILSGVFHWLASQSLFMVQITVTVWKSTGRVISVTDSISTCGFSPVAIILTTVIATAIAVGGIIMGRLKYPAGMPMAGSLSAAISAACHPSEEDIDAHLRPVQWGAVSHGLEFSGGNEPVGHCSFSSLPVELPITGRLYA